MKDLDEGDVLYDGDVPDEILLQTPTDEETKAGEIKVSFL